MTKRKTIQVQNISISITLENGSDFICLTDMANAREGESRAADIIKNWLRNRYTLEFMGTWEQINNPNFKVVEFDHFKMNAGLHSFVLSPGTWVDKTSAIGIIVKLGKYGGTFAHKDIVLEFCSSINPILKIFLLREFQRLKDEESERLKLNWNFHRTIAKVNYQIHTDAIKEKLIPTLLNKDEISYIFTNEADILNVALFGKTAKQ